MLFVYPSETKKQKLVITIDYKTKMRNPNTGEKETFRLNMINTGNYAEEEDIYKNKKYKIIWKK